MWKRKLEKVSCHPCDLVSARQLTSVQKETQETQVIVNQEPSVLRFRFESHQPVVLFQSVGPGEALQERSEKEARLRKALVTAASIQGQGERPARLGETAAGGGGGKQA